MSPAPDGRPATGGIGRRNVAFDPFEMEGGAQNGAWRPDDQSNFSALELDRDECLDLLRHVRIRRPVLSVDCLPVALPVNMSVLDEVVNFSTGTCPMLNAAVDTQGREP
jgi:hypothetical protein